jgi:inosine-uridine nucleoside N-ribohydrolase
LHGWKWSKPWQNGKRGVILDRTTSIIFNHGLFSMTILRSTILGIFGLMVACGVSRAVDRQATPAATLETRLAKIPVILDTDIGDDIDDTWALVLLLKSPQLDLKLVTTTFGKAEYRAKIIAKLLTAAGRTDVPVGLGEGGHAGTGSQQPWVQDYRLSDYPGKIRGDGVAAIIETIEKSPQPITVIAIGPLTTLSAVLERRPEIAARASLAGMHGSVRKGYGGGKKVSAEWNVKAQPAAARRVLSAPWRQITITPLDTCGLVTLGGRRFQALKQSNDPLVKTLLENYRIWSRKSSLDQIQASTTLFDTVAVYLAYPDARPLVERETLSIAVTDDGFTRIDAAGKAMSVATEWKDLDGYRDFLVKVLTGH